MKQCNDTNWYDLPLGDVNTSEHLERYFNSLLCKIDEKLHQVNMSCANPNKEQLECLLSDFTSLRYKVIAVENEQRKQSIQLKCICDRNNENHLDILKLQEQLKIAVVDIDNALLEIKEALARLEQISGDFDIIKDTVEAFDSRISNNEDNISNLRSDVDTMGTEFDNHYNSSNNKFTDLDNTVEDIMVRLVDTETLTDELELSVDTINDSLTNIRNTIDNLSNNTNNLQTVVNTHEGKINALETGYGELSANYVRIRNELDELIENGSSSGDITSLQEKVESLKTSVVNLQNGLNALQTSHEEVKTQIELNTSMITSNYEENRTDINDLKDKSETFRSDINAIQSDKMEYGTVNLILNNINETTGDISRIEVPAVALKLGNKGNNLLNRILLRTYGQITFEADSTRGTHTIELPSEITFKSLDTSEKTYTNVYWELKKVIPDIIESNNFIAQHYGEVTAKTNMTLNKEISIIIKSDYSSVTKFAVGLILMARFN